MFCTPTLPSTPYICKNLEFMEAILQPWPWYISGPLITLTMLLLIYFGKNFGMSSNLESLCSMGGAGKFSEYFKFDRKAQNWNLVVVLGAIIGGLFATQFLSGNSTIALNPNTVKDLGELGFLSAGESLLPPELYSWEHVATLKGFGILIIAGFLVGFGTRYAGGCTSGHAITGLSNLQLPSLVAVIGFFIGGLTMTYFLLPLIFG